MRKRKKILIICTIPVVLIIGGFLYITFGGYLIIDKTVKEEFFADIKNSPQLPERFYEIYDLMYPKSLGPSSWTHFLIHDANLETNTYCVCREAVYAGIYPLYVKTTEIIPIVNMVESNFTQRQCLDYYINKEIKRNELYTGNLYALSDEEIVLLLLKMENTNYYNEKHNPERVQARINEISNILNNNLN